MSQRHELTVISLGAASICVLVSGVFVLVPTSGCGKDMDAVSTQYGLCNPSVATNEYCKAKFCGKDGVPISVNDDSYVPPPQNAACGTVRCKDGKPEETLLAEGTPCNGQAGICDANGSCVHCVEGTNTGCKPGGKCIAGDCAYCFDGKQDPNEADVDCGGPCSPCNRGKKCASPNDCVANSYCVDDVCCAKPCDGPCEACQLHTGACIELPTGETDTGVCEAPKACVNRLCKLRAGANCSMSTECMSAACTVSDAGPDQCAKGTSGDPCVDDADCIPNSKCVDHLCQ